MAVTELEGTWEQILARSAELSGRRVRVTVLSDRQTPAALDQAARQWAQGTRNLIPTPRPPREGQEGELQRMLIDKYRKQGLKL